MGDMKEAESVSTAFITQWASIVNSAELDSSGHPTHPSPPPVPATDVDVMPHTQLEIAWREQASACANRNMLEPTATGAMTVTMVTRVVFRASATSTEPRTGCVKSEEANVLASRTLTGSTATTAHSTTTTSPNADHVTVTSLGLTPEDVTRRVDSVTVAPTTVIASVAAVPLVITITQPVTRATVTTTEPQQIFVTKIMGAASVRRTFQGFVVSVVLPDSSTGLTAFLVNVTKLECRVIPVMLMASVTANATSRARNVTSVLLVFTNIRIVSTVNAMFMDHLEYLVTSRQDSVTVHQHSKA